MSAFLLWLARKLGAQLITPELVRKVIDVVFLALYEAVEKIPGTVDDKALLALEAAIDKDALAAKIVEWFQALA